MQIRQNFSLKEFNTFRLDVPARLFAPFHSLEQLKELLEEASIRTSSKLILGGGSNVLFAAPYDGAVLKNEMEGIRVIKEDAETVLVKAGAGVNWHRFVLYCLDNHFAGVENLSLIPGCVGASPMQNIGAYGVEIKDVFHELEAYHIHDRELKTFSLAECAFGYRESVFKHRYKNEFVITSVTYRLQKKPTFHISYGAIQQELQKTGVKELSIQAVSKAVIAIRQSKLPDWTVIGNAGSFFKNPVVPTHKYESLKMAFPNLVAFPQADEKAKLAAGWLIEQCGWRGYRKGDAGCYEKQALVLVNYGNATGKEILELSEKIIDSVYRKFDVRLEREVNVLE